MNDIYIETYKVSVVLMFFFYTIHMFANIDKKINHVSMWFVVFTPLVNTLTLVYALCKALLTLSEENDKERNRRRRK